MFKSQLDGTVTLFALGLGDGDSSLRSLSADAERHSDGWQYSKIPDGRSNRFLGRGLFVRFDQSASEGFGSAHERGMRRKRNRCDDKVRERIQIHSKPGFQ